MDYPAYPVYRESGIEWLGKIPDHWEVKRLKYVFQLLTEKTERKDNPVGLENIEGWSGRFIETDSEFQGDGVAFEQGDILFGKLRPYLAKVHLAQFAGEAVGDFHVLRPIGEIIGVFGLYQCLNKDFITNVDSSTYGAKMPRVSWEYMANMLLVFPSLTEQRKISAFLDHKTQQIDQLIAKKQTLIDKLNEQRIALITHAVTKGLNPAVTLEDSGVEWLGEVPEHWEVLSIKFLLDIPITDGPHETPEILSEGIPFISAEAVKNDRLDFSKKRGFISLEDHERFSKKYKPRRNDVFMVKSGATTGNVARVETDEEFNIWSPLAALRVKENYASSNFLFYFMKSKLFFYSVELGWSYGTQQNIGMNVISNLKIISPPIEEQREIVEYLDKETARIDRMVELNRETIDKLKEYRTALITAAVTGKIDLRMWQQEANHAV